MKVLAALLFFTALEAVITQIDALNCTRCRYNTILTHDGVEYTGQQDQYEPQKDCFAKAGDYQSKVCVGLPSDDFRFTCTARNAQEQRKLLDNTVEVTQAQYRGCFPLLKTIPLGKLTKAQLQDNLNEWFKAEDTGEAPTFLTGEACVCDTDYCNRDKDFCTSGDNEDSGQGDGKKDDGGSAITFEVSGILFSFAVIIALLLNNL